MTMLPKQEPSLELILILWYFTIFLRSLFPQNLKKKPKQRKKYVPETSITFQIQVAKGTQNKKAYSTFRT